MENDTDASHESPSELNFTNPRQAKRLILNSVSNAVNDIENAIMGLFKLYERDDTSVSSNDRYYSEVESTSSYGTEDVVGNPITDLHNMRASRRLEKPVYETIDVTGEPHERHFIISCNLPEMFVSGQGPSKKCAKRDAAEKMLKWIKAHDNDEDHVSQLQNRLEVYKKTKLDEVNNEIKREVFENETADPLNPPPVADQHNNHQ